MRNLRLILLTLLAVGSAAGCAFQRASPPPSPALITTEAQAVARVVAVEPRFAGIQPRNDQLIGQAHWFEVVRGSGVDAFFVTMRLGWGDCPAGCIDHHQWVYQVDPDGTVTLRSEEGSEPVPPEVWPAPRPGNGTGVQITALAGPVCPVEQDPPDPACASRPVVGATVSVRDAQGTEIASGTLDDTGRAFLATPVGSFVVIADPVVGLMGTPGPVTVVVDEGIATPVEFAYDTGIR